MVEALSIRFGLRFAKGEGGANTRRWYLKEKRLKGAMGHVNSFFTYLVSQFTENQ